MFLDKKSKFFLLNYKSKSNIIETMEKSSKEKIELIKQSFELKHSKKYKEALVLLYKALEYDDIQEDNVELLSQIGQLHILLGNYDRALDEFQRALVIDKHHTFSIQKSFEIYFFQKQYTKALITAQKLCEEDKNPVSYYFYLKTLVQLEKYQDAMEVFNALSEDIKLDTDILYLISTISEGEKKELLLKRIIELDETNEQANLDLAEIAFNKCDWDEVVNCCLNLNENHPIALYYLGVIESTKCNHTRALELFLKAIRYDNDTHDFYLNLAKTYIDISFFSQALLALKKSINYSLVKNDFTNLDEKYFLSGWILIKQNQPQKAAINLNSIRKDSQFYNIAQILIQTVNLKKQNLSTAKHTLEKYLKDESDNLFLLDALGAVYKELKLYKQAIDIYTKAYELYPDSIFYVLEIIDLLIDDKKYDDSIALIEKHIVKHKNCASLYNSLARIHYRKRELEEALAAMNTYLKLDNNNPESYYFRGLILNDLSRFEEGKNSIYEAIRTNPTVAKYYSQMARSYQGLNDFNSALLYAKEALEIKPDEINYKKQLYDIAVSIGDKEQIKFYEKQLKRSESIFKRFRR